MFHTALLALLSAHAWIATMDIQLPTILPASSATLTFITTLPASCAKICAELFLPVVQDVQQDITFRWTVWLPLGLVFQIQQTVRYMSIVSVSSVIPVYIQHMAITIPVTAHHVDQVITWIVYKLAEFAIFSVQLVRK